MKAELDLESRPTADILPNTPLESRQKLPQAVNDFESITIEVGLLRVELQNALIQTRFPHDPSGKINVSKFREGSKLI